MGNDPQNERLWYDLILSSLDFMRREISLRFFVASVPKLIIHRARGIARLKNAVSGCGLANCACSESHSDGSRSTRNDGRPRQCVLGSHAMNN